jgi:hypothetical protein
VQEGNLRSDGSNPQVRHIWRLSACDSTLALTPVEPEPSLVIVFPPTNSADEPKTEASFAGLRSEPHFPSLLSLNRLSRLVLVRCRWRSSRIRASASAVRPDRSARSRRSTKRVMARS